VPSNSAAALLIRELHELYASIKKGDAETHLHERVSLSLPTTPMSVVKKACAAERTSALRSSRHDATAFITSLRLGGVSLVEVTAPLRKLRSACVRWVVNDTSVCTRARKGQ
jgi:hypothetical protein